MKIIQKEITDSFPSYKSLEKLASLCGISVPFKPLFYDIETTGLSRKTTELYLIGTVYYENQSCYLTQWFAEKAEEEKEILSAFYNFAKAFSHTIQFNGNRFDAPYIRERCSVHQLCSPLDELPALDLYQYVKPIKLLLQLNHLKQSDIEEFFSLPPRKYPDGKICIKHYKNYVAHKNQLDFELCTGHNEEDLIGMGKIISVLNYQGLFEKKWSLHHVSHEDDQLLFELQLEYPLPVPIRGGIPGLYLRADSSVLKLLVSIQNQKLQMFYTNYKDYDYLLSEDSVIPKSISSYIDKSLKTSACLENCYTWFTYEDSFLYDEKKLHSYLDHTISYLLAILSR